MEQQVSGRVELIGAGAIGMLLAARLAASAHCKVRLSVRDPRQQRLIATRGLQLHDVSNSERCVIRPIDCVLWQQRLAERPDIQTDADVVLLTVKQQHLTPEFLSGLQAYVGKDRLLICFQNGIGHLERLQSFFSPEQLFVAVTTEGARTVGRNKVQHTGRGNTAVGWGVATNEGRALSEDRALQAESLGGLQEWLTWMAGAGFRCEWTEEPERHMWRKCLLNALINPLTAVFQLKNGQLLTVPHAYQLMEQLAVESQKFMNALGFAEPDHLLALAIDVCRATAANESSMLQDIRAGRVTEIEWINGAILQRAQQLGVDMPVHRKLYEQVRSL